MYIRYIYVCSNPTARVTGLSILIPSPSESCYMLPEYVNTPHPPPPKTYAHSSSRMTTQVYQQITRKHAHGPLLSPPGTLKEDLAIFKSISSSLVGVYVCRTRYVYCAEVITLDICMYMVSGKTAGSEAPAENAGGR
jgi:hypothetical protein